MLTAEQYDLARRLWHYGIRASAIARACEVPTQAINAIATTNREDFPRRRKEYIVIDSEKKMLMQLLRDKGMKYQQIADAVGCHVNTVARHLKGYDGRHE